MLWRLRWWRTAAFGVLCGGGGARLVEEAGHKEEAREVVSRKDLRLRPRSIQHSTATAAVSGGTATPRHI